MKNNLSQVLLVATLLSIALPAAAQTGRIAHFSHGGSPTTLAAGAGDNFGLPTSRSEFIVDSLVYLNDSLAMSYGRYRSVSYQVSDAELKKAPWRLRIGQVQYYTGSYQPQRWQETMTQLQQQNSQTKLVGFDKQLKKRGRKKTTSQSQIFLKRPFQYSFWRGVVGVAGLGAVGWLLGRKCAA